MNDMHALDICSIVSFTLARFDRLGEGCIDIWSYECLRKSCEYDFHYLECSNKARIERTTWGSKPSTSIFARRAPPAYTWSTRSVITFISLWSGSSTCLHCLKASKCRPCSSTTAFWLLRLRSYICSKSVWNKFLSVLRIQRHPGEASQQASHPSFIPAN